MSTLSLADLGPRMRRRLGLAPTCPCIARLQHVASIPVIETAGRTDVAAVGGETPGAAWLRTGLHRLRAPRSAIKTGRRHEARPTRICCRQRRQFDVEGLRSDAPAIEVAEIDLALDHFKVRLARDVELQHGATGIGQREVLGGRVDVQLGGIGVAARLATRQPRLAGNLAGTSGRQSHYSCNNKRFYHRCTGKLAID